MNKKQLLFCKHYIETEDVKIATQKAGYKETTGYRLLKNEEIKSYIKNNKNSKNDNKVAKSDEIIQCLTTIMRGEENDNVSLKGISVRERLKAAELLGKVYSIFSKKQEDDNDKPIFILGDNLLKD